mmetsp:Transcript_3162/g.10558  ORF Transcript_3162/g.10558 Transcript_3162/m.10558 type:complete len:372 (-) Transcript_3162:649-1764(-)
MLRLVAHLHDATGVVRDRTEDVHGQHEHDRGEHAHGRHGRAEEPGVGHAAEGPPAEPVGGEQHHGDGPRRSCSRPHAHRHARDDVGAVAREARLRNPPNGREVEVGVVLRHEDEDEGSAESEKAAGRKVEPSRGVLFAAQQQGAERHDAHTRQGHGYLVAILQHLHGVHVLALGRLRHHDANAADDEVHGVDRQGEQDEAALHVRGELLGEASAKDHGRQNLAGDGLEEVGATAGAIAHVVAHEVRDDRRVAGVVLGDVGLDLPHHVGAHVGGLGVDAAAQLCKERHEGRAKAVAHEEERQLVQLCGGHQNPHAEEQTDDAQQHHRDHEDAAEAPSSQADGHGLLEAPGRRGGHADVRPHRHPHADVAGNA